MRPPNRVIAWSGTADDDRVKAREMFERQVRVAGSSVSAARRERLSDGVRRLLAGLRAKARDGGSR